MRKGRGTLILVLGILAILCTCIPLGVAAWLMGRADLRRMDHASTVGTTLGAGCDSLGLKALP